MELKLSYRERNLLWADLLNVGGDRVFILTDTQPTVGDPVSVLIEAPELSAPLRITALVQGQRPATGISPAGIFVRVDAASLEKCRAAIGTRGPPAATATQKEVRAEFAVSVRLNSPRPTGELLAKSLTSKGFTLKGVSGLADGTTVTGVMTMPDGFEAAIGALVIWTRPDLDLSGFKLTTAAEGAAARISEAVTALKSNTSPPTGITIVVADDDRSILEFAFRAISKLGHRVVRAERGDTALALVRQERPRLVLLDVLMPGLDGLEVCKAMRADEALARIPVVLLSAMGEPRLKDATAQAGANDYLTKPMHLDSLRSVVAKYVG